MVEITDEFTQPYGEWENYAAIEKEQNLALREQKHVNIRSFVPDKPAAQVNMLFMDRLSMYNLDGEGGTGTEIGRYSKDSTPPAHIIIINNEGWSYGEVAPQPDRNNWNGLKVVCKTGETVTQSVITAIG